MNRVDHLDQIDSLVPGSVIIFDVDDTRLPALFLGWSEHWWPKSRKSDRIASIFYNGTINVYSLNMLHVSGFKIVS